MKHDPNAQLQTARTIRWVVGAGGFAVTALLAGLAVVVSHRFSAAAWASGVLALGLWLVSISDKQRGLWGPLIGSDDRVSTSRVAPALWTVSLVWTIAFVVARARWSAEVVRERLVEDRFYDYMIMLGGPFAAFALAKGIVAYKVDRGTLQKVENQSGPDPRQALSDDANQTSLVDCQYLLFNAVALFFFWGAFAKSGELPQIPAMLLAMTSGSAALYVTNKLVEQNAPSIASISPSSARPGEVIVISGYNFKPKGTDENVHPTVTIEGYGTLPVRWSSDSEVRATVPPGVPAGLHRLTVTTTGHVTTEQAQVEIVADVPEINGVLETKLHPGDTIHLLGRHFRSLLDPTARDVSVYFNDELVMGSLVPGIGDEPRVETRVPRSIEGTTVYVHVQNTRGEASQKRPVPLALAPELVATPPPAFRRTSGGLWISVNAHGALPASGIPISGKTQMRIRGTTVDEMVDLGSGSRIVAGSHDYVEACFTTPLDEEGAELSVVDWQGRSSLPIRVTLPPTP